MKSSAYLRLMAMMMMIGGSSPFSLNHNEYQHLSDKEKSDLEERIKTKYREVMLKKGLKEFNINGITVLALNYKNAIRKADRVRNQLKSIV